MITPAQDEPHPVRSGVVDLQYIDAAVSVHAKEMLKWSVRVQLPKYKRHPRGPKKPVPKRTRFADATHVSTAQLLAKSREKAP